METIKWTNEENIKLYNLVEQYGRKWSKIQEYFPNRKKQAIRKHYDRYLSDDAKRINKIHPNPIENAKNKRIHKYLSNGNEESEVLVPEEALQTRESLLIAHGYNPDEFELFNSISNYWDMPDAEKGAKTLFQSKVTVKPKKVIFDWSRIYDHLEKSVKPRIPEVRPIINDSRYLVINLFDMHFGNNTLEDYDEMLGDLFQILDTGYQEIILISGGDLLNENDYRGQTARGTQIGKTDMSQAWEDAFDILDMILHKASTVSEITKLMYLPGNHDEFSGHTVIKALSRVYQRDESLLIDQKQEMYKADMLGHNFIGGTHGDKSKRNEYPSIYATLFSELWGTEGVYTRDLFTGHFHHEATIDKGGLMIRQQPTRNKLDEYHKDNGFITSHRRFAIAEYDEYENKAIYYV